MSYQMTVFDLLDTPEWTNMTLKQIATYISEQTGLNFIPDTRFHGEFNEYIAYYTNKVFFTVGLGKYETYDERNGKPLIDVGYENKKAIGYFSGILRRLDINVASRKHESSQ